MATRDYELDERIDELAGVTTDGDRCLTVAVPPEESVGAVLERIEEAYADASYLHTEEADQASREVLDRARHLLHGYEEEGTPDHGLVCFVGVVDGDTVEECFDDLPHPVEESVYELDNEFDVSPLAGARRESRTDGLLVVERGGAALGRRHGERVEHVETVDSDVMGKTRAGGQSAQRFARERERQKREFFEEVADEAERLFFEDGERSEASDGRAGATRDASSDAEPAIDGLLVGGTTVTVDDFLDEDLLDYRLEDRILGGTFAVEYASEQGLHQLVERAGDVLDEAEDRPAHDALDRFFDAIERDDPVVYGRDGVEEALDYDAVETLLVSESLPADEIRGLENAVDEEGGDLVVVPDGFDRGARFREGFGGVGAILRFPIE